MHVYMFDGDYICAKLWLGTISVSLYWKGLQAFVSESTPAFRFQNSSHLYVYIELGLHSNVWPGAILYL